MFKFSKKLIAILATSFSLSFIAPLASQSFNQPEITASAHAVQSDGPWEYDSNNLPFLQHVTNGNEIYYSIAPNTKYSKYAVSAANAWSNLGVINLIQVPWDDSRSQINVTYAGDYSTEDGENAETDSPTTTDSSTNAYPNSTNIIMTSGMDTDSKIVKEVVLEHEFGHALGFAHDNRHLANGRKYRHYHLTMNAYGIKNTYVLGGIEQRTLADHYGITPDQWLNTNC